MTAEAGPHPGSSGTIMPSEGEMRPRDPRPLAPHDHQLQFLKPLVDYFGLLVACSTAAAAFDAFNDKGNMLYKLLCALVALTASSILICNRTGSTKRLPLLFRVHSLLSLGFPLLWLSGAAAAQPVVLHCDFCLYLFCIPFHLIIGMGDGGVPRFVPVAYVLAHALLLAALHAYLVGKTWPVALGRGVCVELLCVIASIALKRKCKQVYAAYLQRHDRDMAAVLRFKHGGQQLESKDGMADDGENKLSLEGTPAPSETSKAASHLASKPDMGTHSLPMAPLPPHQPCQPSCSSAAGSTTAMPEGSATSSNRVYQSRIRRHQVHIRIEASGLEQVLRHPDFATHFSQRLNEELPGYFAPELAIRVGCIIVSFDLATIEAGLEQKLDDEAALSSPAGKQPMPVSAHSKLLSLAREVLLEYGHKLGLPHGTEISIQADGCTIMCKWDAAARLWALDSGTAPATATRADQCQIRLCSPILQIPSAAKHPGLQQQQQQDQPAHAGQSIPLPVTASLRGEHAGGRVVQGWDAEPRREEHSTAASDELEGTPKTNGPALQLVARTQGRFLPVVMAHQSPSQPDEQLIEAQVLLPSSLADASDPFTLELELWTQDVCLSSQSALAIPSHLESLAQEVSAWAAETVNQPQEEAPASDDFVCDLADFLSFCSNRKQYQQSQAEAMDAVGRDLLQFASDAKMKVLAAHLRHKVASLLSPDSKGGSNEGMTSSSRNSSKPGAVSKGTPTAAGRRHRSQPMIYSDFEFQFLQPCILPWVLPIFICTTGTFLMGDGGLFHFFLSALVLVVAAMMVAYNRAGNTERVRLLFRIHSCCWLGYHMIWLVGAATAQPFVLFGDFFLHLFGDPFHLIIGMGDGLVPRFVPVAYALTQAFLVGALHATVGDKSWPAALRRGACVELLCVIATVILKRKCKQMYAAYLQRCDRDLAVACSNKQG